MRYTAVATHPAAKILGLTPPLPCTGGFLLDNVMCEYCEEYRKPLDKQGNFSVWMLGSDMVVHHSFGQTLVPVNFCPMCGKKLVMEVKDAD